MEFTPAIRFQNESRGIGEHQILQLRVGEKANQIGVWNEAVANQQLGQLTVSQTEGVNSAYQKRLGLLASDHGVAALGQEKLHGVKLLPVNCLHLGQPFLAVVVLFDRSAGKARRILDHRLQDGDQRARVQAPGLCMEIKLFDRTVAVSSDERLEQLSSGALALFQPLRCIVNILGGETRSFVAVGNRLGQFLVSQW